jgi:hypothetical protein
LYLNPEAENKCQTNKIETRLTIFWIQRDRKSGTLALSQRRFVEKLLELFGMSKAKPVKTRKYVTPY